MRKTSPLSIEDAVSHLHMISQLIKQICGVNSREIKCVQHDVSLALSRYPQEATRGKRQIKYLTFLHDVQKTCGNSMVILSIVGLGFSVIVATRENVLMGLPYQIKEQIHKLDNSILTQLSKDSLSDCTSIPEGLHMETPCLNSDTPTPTVLDEKPLNPHSQVLVPDTLNSTS